MFFLGWTPTNYGLPRLDAKPLPKGSWLRLPMQDLDPPLDTPEVCGTRSQTWMFEGPKSIGSLWVNGIRLNKKWIPTNFVFFLCWTPKSYGFSRLDPEKLGCFQGWTPTKICFFLGWTPTNYGLPRLDAKPLPKGSWLRLPMQDLDPPLDTPEVCGTRSQTWMFEGPKSIGSLWVNGIRLNKKWIPTNFAFFLCWTPKSYGFPRLDPEKLGCFQGWTPTKICFSMLDPKPASKG